MDGARRGLPVLSRRLWAHRLVLGCLLVEDHFEPDASLPKVGQVTSRFWNSRCPETREQMETVRHRKPAAPVSQGKRSKPH